MTRSTHHSWLSSFSYIFYQKPYSNSYKGLDDIPSDDSYIYMTFGTDKTFTRHSVLYVTGQDGEVQVLDNSGTWSLDGDQLSTKTTDQRIVVYETVSDYESEAVPETARHDQADAIKSGDEDLTFKVKGNALKQTILQGSLDGSGAKFTQGECILYHELKLEVFR